MNPLAIFIPAFRAGAGLFLIGLVVLAALDAARLWILSYGVDMLALVLVLMLAIFFFTASLFINRLRDAGRGVVLFLLPWLLAIAAKGVGALVSFLVGTSGAMQRYAEETGQNALTAAQDPAFQQEFQAHMESRPEEMMAIFMGGAWPSFAAFWLVLALFALWFAGMKRRDGAPVA